MTSAPWRSRIVRHADVAPAELAAHPLNFRRHPKGQADALAAAIDTVGVVQSVIVSERSGRILDGHLRAELALARGEPSLPAVYVDVDEDEERLILATFDPLGALAETDAGALSALLDSVVPTADGLADLLASLRPPEPLIPTASDPTEPTLLSDCLIEIRCSTAFRDEIAPTLADWSTADGCTVDIS